MENKQIQNDLSHIRNMMERSSRFLSLSGLAGVFAGVFALIGTITVFFIMKNNHIDYFQEGSYQFDHEIKFQIILIAILVLFSSILVASILTYQKSKKQNAKIWTIATRKILFDFCIPLLAGGVVCLALIYHNLEVFLSPCSLIFYGIALYFSERYTFSDVAYLGFSLIIIGLFSFFFLAYGLIFWALGFGVLHIFYGVLMHKKYK